MTLVRRMAPMVALALVTMMLPAVAADDQPAPDLDLEPWLDRLWEAIEPWLPERTPICVQLPRDWNPSELCV